MRHAATQTRPGVCRIHFHLRHLFVSRRSSCSRGCFDKVCGACVTRRVFTAATADRLEMPGSGNASVKCEPQSDEEDSNNQLPESFFRNRLPEFHSLASTKVDASCHNEEGMPTMLHQLQSPEGLEELAPQAPAATPVCVIKQEPVETHALDLETLESASHSTGSLLERHIALLRSSEVADSASFTPLPLPLPLQTVKDEPSSEGEQQHLSSDEQSDAQTTRGSPKSWTQHDMQHALDALRNHNMSLTKASATYGIPSTTLWQRAHRLGIDTPKKEGAAKSWSEADLRGALHALRAGAISANKASKAYGIPSSTLYKIARREGIRLAAPFNAAPVAWRRHDLQRALAAIRAGRASVQRAASEYGIPTGTLYGRCKREGIELSRSNPTPWSEDAMGEALEAVKIGQMSINQAAIHYNLPYSSLYGRFKRCKYQTQPTPHQEVPNPSEMVHQDQNYYHQMPMYPEQDPSVTLQPYPSEFVQDPQSMSQDAYSGQTMYYNQNFSSIATS